MIHITKAHNRKSYIKITYQKTPSASMLSSVFFKFYNILQQSIEVRASWNLHIRNTTNKLFVIFYLLHYFPNILQDVQLFLFNLMHKFMFLKHLLICCNLFQCKCKPHDAFFHYPSITQEVKSKLLPQLELQQSKAWKRIFKNSNNSKKFRLIHNCTSLDRNIANK